MSDVEGWEYLDDGNDGVILLGAASRDAAQASASQAGTHSTAAASSATTAAAASSPIAISCVRPLCLCINQKYSRIGVGHESGFLVFRLRPTLSETHEEVPAVDPKDAEAPEARKRRAAKPALCQLQLDPQYNTDAATFSMVRKHMIKKGAMSAKARGQAQSTGREEQKESTSSSACGMMAEHAVRDVMVDTCAVPQTEGGERLPSLESSSTCSSTGIDIDVDVPSASFRRLLGTDDLIINEHNIDVFLAHSRFLESHQQHAPAADNEEKEATTERSNIADAALQKSREYSSCSHKSRAHSRHRNPTDVNCGVNEGARDTSGVEDSSFTLQNDFCGDEEDETGDEDGGTVGFAGGGVAVMALLYELPSVALVGGGPAPMGDNGPHRIYLLHGGHLEHTIAAPRPVLRVLLDTRILFAVTTCELVVYANPLQPELASCVYSFSFADAAAAAPAAGIVGSRWSLWSTGLASTVSGQPTTLAVHETSPQLPPTSPTTDDSAEQRSKTGEETGGRDVPPPSVPATAAVPHATAAVAASPTVPFPLCIDYANGRLLIRSAASPLGFTLLRYSADLAEGPLAVTGARVRLEEIATQQRAHKNRLASLALCADPAPMPSTSSGDTGVGSTKEGGDGTGEDAKGHAGGAPASARAPVERALVAACSEYATRITMWQLVPNTTGGGSGGAANVMDGAHEKHGVQGVEGTLYATQESRWCFVELREFRIGFRVPVFSRVPSAPTPPPPPSSAMSMERGMPAAVLDLSGSRLSATANNASMASTSAIAAALSPGPPSMTASGTFTASAVATIEQEAHRVEHLQFVHGGRFLFATRGTTMHFFACYEETSKEAKDMCRDHLQAQRNRRSKLGVVSRMIPDSLNLVAAYTRQAWSACEARFPVKDTFFYPKWLYIYKQDLAAAAAAAAAAAGSSTGALSSSRSGWKQRAGAAHHVANAALGGAMGLMRNVLSSGDRRGSSDPRDEIAATASAEDAGKAKSWWGGVFRSKKDAKAALESAPFYQQQTVPRETSSTPSGSFFSTSSGIVGETNGSVGMAVPGRTWGLAFTHLAPCLLIWEHDLSVRFSTSAALAQLLFPSQIGMERGGGAVGRGGEGPDVWSTANAPYENEHEHLQDRQRYSMAEASKKVVLSCATCEGAFLSIRLYTESGEIYCSKAVPYKIK